MGTLRNCRAVGGHHRGRAVCRWVPAALVEGVAWDHGIQARLRRNDSETRGTRTCDGDHAKAAR